MKKQVYSAGFGISRSIKALGTFTVSVFASYPHKVASRADNSFLTRAPERRSRSRADYRTPGRARQTVFALLFLDMYRWAKRVTSENRDPKAPARGSLDGQLRPMPLCVSKPRR